MTAKNDVADQGISRARKWWGTIAIVLAAAVVSGFYGINEYASRTGAILRDANANAGRFEAIFADLKEARFRAMNIASEVMLQSRVTVEAFANNDRDALVARMEPFFQVLQKDHGVAQLNFWTAPAKVYYRAGSPNIAGQDLSKYRKSIVAAHERNQKILAVETGLGGSIGIRAITPVVVAGKLAGVLEFVSDFTIPLQRASATSGLKWAVGVVKDVSENVERPTDAKNDAWKGNDVFFIYSDPTTGDLVRAADFDPRAAGSSVAGAGGRTVFVKTFPVVNFSGRPTIVVASVLDVTEAFAADLRAVSIRASILFLVLAVGGAIGYLQFGRIRGGFVGALYRQRTELAERTRAYEAAMAKLKEADALKRGFFANLVAAIDEPLRAVTGQLRTAGPALAALDGGGAPSTEQRETLRDRFAFALKETARLSALVSDYQQLELFRQKLVKVDTPPVSIA